MRAAETAARTAYGRLIGILAARSGDIASAEDALSDAFAAALATWPDRGVPQAPEAWLLSAAKRNLIDRARRKATATKSEPDLISSIEDLAMDGADPDMPDPRLGLLFLCAHPAIDFRVRTPLMLQTVLGVSAERIASVYMINPKAMSGRLVRAKSKIKAAGIPFGIPGPEAWTDRLDAVLAAVYGAYTASWGDMADTSGKLETLHSEAEWIARLLVQQLPDSGECKGLLALILFCEARRSARTHHDAYIPLRDQDTSLWDSELVGEAQRLLRGAASNLDGGRYQLEAAIQSVHALRAVTGETDWASLLKLYDVLLATTPSLGAAIARAAVLAEVDGPHIALAALDELPADRLASHGPYHATLAHCLANGGHTEAALTAYKRAAELTPDAAVRDWLDAKARQLRS